MKTKKITIVVPVHNEQGNLAWHNDLIISVLKQTGLLYEIIYVDDGSTDKSAIIIKSFLKKNKNIRFIRFSRNFGKEAATTAGLHASSGDVVLLIDADGQHPIELLDKFLEQWNSGYEVVIGVRSSNQREGFIKRYGSKLFYWMLSGITTTHTTPASTDFRLLDKKVVDEFRKLTEHNRITRGLIDWLGYKRTEIKFDARARYSGDASYNYRKLINLAFHAFVSQSTVPLKFVGFLGILISLLSMFIGLFVGIETLIGDPLNLAVTGSAFLAIFLSFLVGIVLICQGLLALYIESIYSESRNRPLYVISEEL